MANDILSNVWPEWQIVRKIGRGAYGTVYEAVRNENQVESKAAIKVISIPQDDSEVDTLRSEGLSVEATTTYFKGVVDDFVKEIQLMESLKGIQNIVSVEDYKVVQKQGEEIGWDIYIRMELLTPFSAYICDKKLSEQEVIKIGCDICSALELCARLNVIHRDIKPENIFINDFGDFKLGDFGIARKLESSTASLSQKGTPNYMAPEIEKGTQYDATVDIYSLGLVLYRLMNNNRLPFLDTEKQLLNPNDRMVAIKRRMDGEPLPGPCDASPEMAEVILCACEYDPSLRFASATIMKNALQNIKSGTYDSKTMLIKRGGETLDKTVSVREYQQSSQSNSVGNEKSGKKKSKAPAIIASVAAAIVLVGGAVLLLPKLLKNDITISTNSSNTVSSVTSESSSTQSKEESSIREQTDEEKINEIIKSAEEEADKGDLKSAVSKINAGLKLYPDSKLLSDKQTEYNDAIAAQEKAELLEEADKLAESGNYESALEIIEDAMGENSDDIDYTAAYDKYYQEYVKKIKTDALAQVDELTASEDYLGAIKVIDDTIKVIGEDNELTKKSSSCEKAYVTKLKKDINQLIGEGKFDAAVELVNEGEKALPDNKEIPKLIEVIENSKPTYLLIDMTITERDFFSSVSDKIIKDTVGNEYYSKNGNIFILGQNGLYADESYVIYYLGGEYSKLKMDIAVDFNGESGKNSFNVYGNEDTLIYTTGVVGRDFIPQKLELDVSGLDWVRFRLSDRNYNDIRWIIANPRLYK